MVNYRLRNDLQNLRVCLYCPNGQSIDQQFIAEALVNYIVDCAWQISNGESISRFPYHITPSIADAKRAEEKMRRKLLSLRKENNQMKNQQLDQREPHKEDKPTEKRYSWGYSG